MPAVPPMPGVAQIGETAGTLWCVLSENGPLTMTNLVKLVGQPHNAVMLALGWLAREDKIHFEEKGRTRVVSLRE
ncbi:MAG TPA: winged helix-turn-helix domain-containing protein [Thermoguttaceae bacterium]|nr:winged helix-turn-helix domain-containing protein [Thermoguttaceae bacterium]